MSEEQLQNVSIDDLDLRGEEDDIVDEEDTSEEATAEAGLTDEGVELTPSDDIEFEEDDSGVAQ
jgi:hypothetical protein